MFVGPRWGGVTTDSLEEELGWEVSGEAGRGWGRAEDIYLWVWCYGYDSETRNESGGGSLSRAKRREAERGPRSTRESGQRTRTSRRVIVRIGPRNANERDEWQCLRRVRREAFSELSYPHGAAAVVCSALLRVRVVHNTEGEKGNRASASTSHDPTIQAIPPPPG
jgi:hypothetical protein